MITLKSYSNASLYGEDYTKIRDFLLELEDSNYSFGRWDWMISHSYLEVDALCKIGIWEDDAAIVGLATYDTQADGNCFFPLKSGYEFLRTEMISYAEKHLARNGDCQLLIHDCDETFQNAAQKSGYIATAAKDSDAVFIIDEDSSLDYELPAGFSVTSMKDRYDLYQYGRVLWKGFNHELDGEGAFMPAPEELVASKKEFERPNVNLDIKIAVVAPDGNFVSYCGMWQDDRSQNALVEPVATDPAYRKMGLGRAAVLEAIRRCGELGAKKVYVGSSQQFYYSIGFRPMMTSTYWKRK